MATEFSKTLLDEQACQVAEQQVNQHFENHLCSQNMGLLTVQPPDTAASLREFYLT
jgi:hypothetical protein